MRAATRRAAAVALAAALGAAAPATGQEAARGPDWDGVIEPLSGFAGQMSMVMESSAPDDMAITDTIRFEPWQMLGDLFRDDIVLLMRSGPTDWRVADAPDAGLEACDRQRGLTEEGRDAMRQLGALLVVNELTPGAVRAAPWCRAQETYAALERGMLQVDRDALDGMSVRTPMELAPVPDAAEAADVAALRDLVLGWDGGDGDGPLLIVTEFPDIAALTRFHVYEGEMLILDPRRDGRVLGYLRLASATPDPIHFDPSVVTATIPGQ